MNTKTDVALVNQHVVPKQLPYDALQTQAMREKKVCHITQHRLKLQSTKIDVPSKCGVRCVVWDGKGGPSIHHQPGKDIKSWNEVASQVQTQSQEEGYSRCQ